MGQQLFTLDADDACVSTYTAANTRVLVHFGSLGMTARVIRLTVKDGSVFAANEEAEEATFGTNVLHSAAGQIRI